MTSTSERKLNRMGNPFGVGSQMSKMFAFFLIHATPDCPCHEHARQYDYWGPDVCLENMDTILNRLDEQSRTRGIPFSRYIAERFVRIAIWKARKGKQL